VGTNANSETKINPTYGLGGKADRSVLSAIHAKLKRDWSRGLMVSRGFHNITNCFCYSYFRRLYLVQYHLDIVTCARSKDISIKFLWLLE